ncbi:Clavaminate synthase-like protein [Mytilinidion resinicola]|uniref:Clavaminate synthase-like protein n=1 Tax=Mytilinidion resinicola TaxID=574789 RepID=A0A6A6Y7T9_9PEZI|nr:Clavaminate synthase-like protein [Mytilinidion resinicola]KAF2804603.1 Clavaminate synthase-like protein [Mytilinidion resinicola]
MATKDSASTLPTIDLSPFLDPNSSTEERESTVRAIDSACTEFGFFYLTGHGIPSATTDRVLSLAREFFSLPKAQKEKIARAKDGFRGYQGLGENVTLNSRDMHEAVDLYREVGTINGPRPPFEALQGLNPWPEEPEELRPFYEDYIQECMRVCSTLLGAMGVALKLSPALDAAAPASTEDDDVFVRNTTNSFWIMRMIGYPPLAKPLSSKNGNEDRVEEFSCGEHSDYGCLTLLLADPTKNALQVRLKSGGYLNVDPVPGAFVVNIGDMVERWTNGQWHSVRHRVIHRGEGYRVSVPFFYEPNWDAVVKPLKRCVKRSGGVVKYEEAMYGDHLMGKLHNNFYNGGD